MADANGLFWNSSNGDRTYNADSFSEWLGKFFTTGIFNGELQVTPAGGMNVNVATGYANIQGKVKFFDTATQFTVPTANSTYPRIDTIVVQADYTNRTISMEYVQGSYSGNNPTPQAPVRDTGIYQLVLAQIRVNAGATEVTTANITDTRANADLCGWVTGTVDHVAVSQLTEQAQAEFAIWFDHMKDQLSEDAAGNLQLEVDTLAGSIAYVEHAIADIDHVKGSYVTIGNQMYKVTAAVTAGDTFEIGVNIERISVGEELTSLNKGLGELFNRLPVNIQLLLGNRSYRARQKSYSGTNYASPYGIIIIGYNVLDLVSSVSITSPLGGIEHFTSTTTNTVSDGTLQTGWDGNRQYICICPPNVELVEQ